MKKLTHKQEMFCKEYVIDFNGTNAAVRAGYSKKGAEVTASLTLRNIKVSEKIKELLHSTEKEYKVSRKKVLKAVEDIAYDGEQEANRKGALDMLMRHTGLYELDNVPSVVVINNTDGDKARF